MRLKTIFKRFIFEESNRSELTFGTDTRLNPGENRLELVATDGVYPTTADLNVKTWVANPLTVKQWIGFDVIAQHQKGDDGITPLSSLGFRLSDGTDEYWWNGAAWEVNTSDWNTEAEVSNNIASFPVTERKIQVVINLVTTDESVTPYVFEILVAYKSNVEFEEDLIARSLIPALRNGIRPISDFVIELSSATATIDLENDYPLETPYDITEIDSVYNKTDDPNQFTDLFQSYNPSTKVITLSSSVGAGKLVWIKFTYKPMVAISTDVNYIEVDTVPAIHITSVKNNVIELNHDTAVRNKSAKTAVQVVRPNQVTVNVSLVGVTSLMKDQMRLGDELERFFANNKQLTSVGLDEKYDMIVTKDYEPRPTQGEDNVKTGLLSISIRNTLKYHRDERNAYIVDAFKITGDVSVAIN